jgi:hypothetical protein
MMKGGEVEIEGGKLTFEEQLALAEAAEKARREAEALAQKEAEEAWNKYKAEQLVLAEAKASALTASTAPVILAEVNKAKAKAAWLRAEVSNSKKRAEDNIAKLANTIDPDERVQLDAAITNELKTLQDWQINKPVNLEALRKANIRYGLGRGWSRADAEAWADDHNYEPKGA